MAYRYRGQAYRVVLSGQDPTHLIGSAPYSWFKILGVILAGLALVALIALAATSA
ncbi:MAG: hypothetical protein JRH11_26365 [Deltaproteobacteria bacterium]|nr:hypothetical protein [Deltaproteobacteria bacterium]